MTKSGAWNKGKRKYIVQCQTCKKEIKMSRPGKFCNAKCYFESEQFKKHLIKNGHLQKGKNKKPFIIKWGYIYIFKPDHPYCHVQGYIAEHRLKMEEKLGRYLTEKELVHHKNGNRKDNQIDNLELTDRHSHPSKHKQK